MPSFDDLMSSSRGPGVIGTVLALIVLLGFSGLFLFVFNDATSGPAAVSLATIVQQQESHISELQATLKADAEKLTVVPGLEKTALDADTLARHTKARTATVTELQAQIARLKQDQSDISSQTAAYQAKYRAQMRAAAKGEILESIQTISGKTFKHATIREVTPIGMQIRHDDGFTRIPCEDLPADLQARFQFDKQEKLDALKSESNKESELAKQVEAANAAQSAADAVARDRQAQEDRTKAAARIQSIEQQLKSIESDIKDLQQQANAARSHANSASSAGHRVIDNSPSFLAAIQVKKNQRDELLQEMQRLRSKL